MAELNDISVYKGEDVSLNFTMSPTTDITGWTIALSLRNNANDPDPALLTVAGVITNAAAGQFSVILTNAQTRALTGNTAYAYDVQRTDASSVAVLSIGTFTCLQEVRIP